MILYNQGEAEKSAEQFQKALALIDRMTERERYRTRGNYYILVHNHRKAIEEYQQLLERYPADTGGYNGLAFAYFLARDMERALAQGRRGVEIYPKFVPLRSNLALYALYAGDFAAAEKEARTVLEQNPTYLKAYVALALSKVGQGRLDEALETYRRLEGRERARGVLRVDGRGRRRAVRGTARRRRDDPREGNRERRREQVRTGRGDQVGRARLGPPRAGAQAGGSRCGEDGARAQPAAERRLPGRTRVPRGRPGARGLRHRRGAATEASTRTRRPTAS